MDPKTRDKFLSEASYEVLDAHDAIKRAIDKMTQAGFVAGKNDLIKIQQELKSILGMFNSILP